MNILHENSRTKKSHAAAWANRAPDLAEWAMTQLVNRTDRHGHYLPLHRRTADNNAITAGALTLPILSRHFAGRDVGDLIGLHSTSSDGTCRWCAWDFDAHGEFDAAIRDANEQAAYSLFYRMENQGFRPILEDSNGRGGYHVWLIFNRPSPVAAVHYFAQRMIDDDATETYPKQAKLTGKGLGNWLRLPGRHHTLNHWSKIYHRQGGWMEGAEAIRQIIENPYE